MNITILSNLKNTMFIKSATTFTMPQTAVVEKDSSLYSNIFGIVCFILITFLSIFILYKLHSYMKKKLKKHNIVKFSIIILALFVIVYALAFLFVKLGLSPKSEAERYASKFVYFGMLNDPNAISVNTKPSSTGITTTSPTGVTTTIGSSIKQTVASPFYVVSPLSQTDPSTTSATKMTDSSQVSIDPSQVSIDPSQTSTLTQNQNTPLIEESVILNQNQQSLSLIGPDGNLWTLVVFSNEIVQGNTSIISEITGAQLIDSNNNIQQLTLDVKITATDPATQQTEIITLPNMISVVDSSGNPLNVNIQTQTLNSQTIGATSHVVAVQSDVSSLYYVNVTQQDGSTQQISVTVSKKILISSDGTSKILEQPQIFTVIGDKTYLGALVMSIGNNEMLTVGVGKVQVTDATTGEDKPDRVQQQFKNFTKICYENGIPIVCVDASKQRKRAEVSVDATINGTNAQFQVNIEKNQQLKQGTFSIKGQAVEKGDSYHLIFPVPKADKNTRISGNVNFAQGKNTSTNSISNLQAQLVNLKNQLNKLNQDLQSTNINQTTKVSEILAKINYIQGQIIIVQNTMNQLLGDNNVQTPTGTNVSSSAPTNAQTASTANVSSSIPTNTQANSSSNVNYDQQIAALKAQMQTIINNASSLTDLQNAITITNQNVSKQSDQINIITKNLQTIFNSLSDEIKNIYAKIDALSNAITIQNGSTAPNAG